MKKKSFDYLKTLASLENCIDVVEADVKQLPKDLDLGGLKNRIEHLRFWLDKLIKEYEAR